MAALNPLRTAAALRWQVQRCLQLPLAGRALPALALAAAVLAALWCWHADRLLQQQLQRQASAQLAVPAAAAGTSLPLEGQLQQFLTTLPGADDIPVAVQTLLDLAEQQGLRLQRGSYRLQPEPGTRFARLRMGLPVRGDPVRVQRFMQQALLALPSLAIDSVQFKRDGDDGRLLEARIQWVLFVRSTGSGDAAGRLRALPAPAPAARP